MSDDIGARKDHHIDLCLEQPVESAGASTGLGGYRLEYDALPEVDLEEIDLSTTLLGKKLRAPLLIGSMTGGTERAARINRRLARAAARVGVGMGLGSQRAMIQHPELTSTFVVREAAPELPLLMGNIGAVQLNLGVTPDQIAEALRAVDADGVYFHLNPLQEAIQPEGDTCFAGLTERLADAMAQIPLPAMVKEVGAGISERTARKLAGLPLAGVEVAGVGGTSWARVESYRAPESSTARPVGQRLAGFGTTTGEAIGICRAHLGERVVLASGGIRGGLDVAVAIALGADGAAMARPMLEAAVQSEEAVVRVLETVIFELRVLCFCTGARNLAELRQVRVFAPGESAGPRRE